MRTLRTLLIVGAAAAVAAVLACQSYEFEKVDPLTGIRNEENKDIEGLQKPAKIMLVLDKSGSMKTFPENSTYGCCAPHDPVKGTGNTTTICGTDYQRDGTCKWNSLKTLLLDGVNGFLAQTADKARAGVAIFPHPEAVLNPEHGACADGEIRTQVPAEVGGNNAAVDDVLEGITPAGGTPTARILQIVAENAEFMREEPATKRYVILITDGLPNCNDKLSACTACTNTGRIDTNPPCGGLINCLDDTRVIDAVKALKTKGVDTFVIGFGADTGSGVAKDVLDRAAIAGGQAQPETAATRYYQAGNDADLQAILKKIAIMLQQCTFSLAEAPPAENMLEIAVFDKETKAERLLVRDTDWKYEGTDLKTISLQDDASCAGVTVDQANPPEHCWCKLLQNATPNRFALKFVAVKILK